MKATRINDFMTKDGYIREDGRVIRDLLVYRVKTPSESTGPWDLLEQIDVIPGEEAFRPLAEGGCPYLKAQ
jgi:branched-chain amino acid transport system substrate-binding protein